MSKQETIETQPDIREKVDYKRHPEAFRKLTIVVAVISIILFVVFLFLNDGSPHRNAAIVFATIAMTFTIATGVFIRMQLKGIKTNTTQTAEKHSNYDFYSNFYIMLFGLSLVFIAIGAVVFSIYPLEK